MKKSRIGIIGTGYVGLVQGVVLAEFGLNVICMDIDKEKINRLKCGECIIYEPGLQEMLKRNLDSERIRFTFNAKEMVENSDVIFIAVGTPAMEDGSADIHYVLDAAGSIAENMADYKIIVDKSTVPVGTARLVEKRVAKILKSRGLDINFDVVSNPEFLREGKALHDCMNPDRIVIGTNSDKAKKIMQSVYDVFKINQPPLVFTNLETAELIKYASNAFLAVKISYINEMACIAEKVGANIQDIARVMGMDGRISPKFLHAGPGYGGSCFPKDTKAIVDIGKTFGEEMKVISAAIEANEKQKQKMVYKIVNAMSTDGNLIGKNICILGLSFKPETDDMREAPALTIIPELIKKGAKIQAYCPQGMKEAKIRLKNHCQSIVYSTNEYEAARGADAVVLMTEWYQFRAMNLERIRENMRGEFFFDLRNVFSKNRDDMQNFIYHGVGI